MNKVETKSGGFSFEIVGKDRGEDSNEKGKIHSDRCRSSRSSDKVDEEPLLRLAHESASPPVRIRIHMISRFIVTRSDERTSSSSSSLSFSLSFYSLKQCAEHSLSGDLRAGKRRIADLGSFKSNLSATTLLLCTTFQLVRIVVGRSSSLSGSDRLFRR